MTDHATWRYLDAVACHLDTAGFYVLSVTLDDRALPGGRIELGCQDGWDHYDRGDADLRWDEQKGWTIRWGLTDDLSVPLLATPAAVAMAVGLHVGQAFAPVEGETFDSPRVEPGTPEFDAALAAYENAKEAT